MSDLPPGWAWSALGEITAIVSGSTPKTGVAEYWGGDIAWITPDDLSRNRSKTITRGARSITQAGYDSCSTTLMPAGSVLYSSRAPIGYAAIAAGPVCTNQGFKSFVPSETITSDFLYWFLVAATPAIRKLGSGTTFPELSKTKAKEVAVPVPPLNEQRRIVAAIEEHLSRLDAADASLVLALRRARALHEGFLDEAVDGHAERPLGDFARVYVGATPSRRRSELWGGGVPWVSSGEVAFGRISNTRETIAAEAVTSADRLHPPGTVLLGMIGEGKTRGQAAILDVAATHNQNSAAIRLDPAVSTPEWLFYVLMARYEETRRAGTGGQQPALNRARVSALMIPLPPLEEQQRIVAEVEQRLSAIDALRAAIERAQRRSAALRRAVLERAFRGELVPQDPSDEPAEALLARIRAERDTSIEATGRRRPTVRP